MNGFDLLMIVALVIFAMIGAWRGFVREIFSLLTWIVGCVVAWVFAPNVATLFEGMIGESTLRQMLGFVLLFTVVFVLGTVIALVAHRLVAARRGLQLSNIALGGLIGLGRGGLLLVIAFMLAGLSDLPQRRWWRESQLAPYVENLALFASGYIPRDVARHIRYG